jgi:membrane protein DedA with SNARE-associated domain
VNESMEFLVRHGYALLFGIVLIEQLGLPLPSPPVLLAAGALAGLGQLNLALVVLLPAVAALLADFVWFELGRRKGMWVLQLLCRISLEPDSCVRRTEEVFGRHGPRSLLVAKFMPGLNTVAPPLAGVFRMSPARFLAYDAAGTALWIVTFVGLGYLLSDQLELIAHQAERFGTGLVGLIVSAAVLWIAWKAIARWLFIRTLRTDRITPAELQARIGAGEEILVVDLRGTLEFESDPRTIPGALRAEAARLDEIRERLLGAAEVVLFCT